MRLLLITVVAVVAGGTGCYRTYTGSYYLPGWTVEGTSEARILLETVETAIEPFGFRKLEVGLGPEIVSYVNVNKIEGPQGVHHPGRLRVMVGFDMKRPKVLLGDLDHDYETRFVRSVKDSIEKGLKARFGLTELKFVRHIDLFE